MIIKKYLTYLLSIPLVFLFLSCAEAGDTGVKPMKGKQKNTSQKEDIQLMNNISKQFIEFSGNVKDLQSRLDKFVANAEKVDEGQLIALLVPHAGYRYSGQIAAQAYKQLENQTYDTVIVIGPSHRAYLRGNSVVNKALFESPLGLIKTDTSFSNKLISEGKDISYYPEAHVQEHSVEVQIPFLQKVLKDFKLVQIVAGMQTEDSINSLVDSIIKYSQEKNILTIASTDFSHFHSYDTANKMDNLALEAIKDLNPENLADFISKGKCELCGAVPAIITMRIAKALGANKVKVLKYANSGDVTGIKDKVVGYAAVGFYKTAKLGGNMSKEELSQEEKKELLALARKTIEGYVTKKEKSNYSSNNPHFLQESGAFVTIKKHGMLRGCIGNFYANQPLYKTIEEMAIAAATQDPRFPSLTQEEIKDIDLEISVLSPLQKTTDINEIKVGKHGIYIIKGLNRGVLLPQVAVEYGWDRDTFLDQTCRKAGLPTDAWHQEGTEIYIFTAQIFGEKGE